MIDSIPLVALELEIGFEEYKEISRSIGRVKLIPKEERGRIIKIANEILPGEKRALALDLIREMTYDKKVYILAGLNYAEGPLEEEDLFTTAVADYLLRNSRSGSEFSQQL